MAASACSDGAPDTATNGDDGGGIVVEGITDDDTGSGDTGSDDTGSDSDGDADSGDVPPLPDIDDLELDEPTFTYEVTGDPCTDMATVVVGSTAQALANQSEEEQQAVFLNAVEPFGDEAVASVVAVIEADDPDVDEEEFAELVAALDEITLEPCGWPLYGALFEIAQAAPVVFCEDAMEAADDGFEPEPERCDQDGIAPTYLPCFAAIDADVDTALFITSGWETIDCDSGAPVEWDGQVGAWVETTEAAPGPGEAVPVPAPASTLAPTPTSAPDEVEG
ncbi:MAG: hypothetical protein R8F63_08975 [Acidimicrobiales bacterium]|nr:hypothetical protein [Acidimicrobiales bacterium]